MEQTQKEHNTDEHKMGSNRQPIAIYYEEDKVMERKVQTTLHKKKTEEELKRFYEIDKTIKCISENNLQLNSFLGSNATSR
jgi:hypothetical protein